MNKYVSQLVKLSNINKEIDAFEPQVDKIKKTLESAFEKVTNLELTIEALEEDIKEAKVKRSKNELHLAELSDKLASIGKKQSAVKSEKESKALQLEEDIAKEQCDFANDEINRFDKIITLKEDEIKQAKDELLTLVKSADEIKESMSGEREIIEKEMAKVYKKKDELVATMSQKILTFYEKIRKWAHNTAVVPVRKQACYGCFMRINDKTNALVMQSEDIITCPHCGRILYKEDEEIEVKTDK